MQASSCYDLNVKHSLKAHVLRLASQAEFLGGVRGGGPLSGKNSWKPLRPRNYVPGQDSGGFCEWLSTTTDSRRDMLSDINPKQQGQWLLFIRQFLPYLPQLQKADLTPITD